ncbi:MAG TPA: type I 3-dehydroquinate dehydratase [Oscillospiraceae bacterium]|nr:type I 3-dehydroquinate dehydratase [Oscillospiraceae bacterium]
MQSKKELHVKGRIIGGSNTNICVPLLSPTLPELLAEAEAMARLQPDLVEWRVDYFRAAKNLAAVTAALFKLRTVLPACPLIVTCRDHVEGGCQELSQPFRMALLQTLLQTGQTDFIDVEYSLGQDKLVPLLTAAQQQGAHVIVSYHNFAQTPAPSALFAKLLQLQKTGADIIKIAVMPQEPQDVLNLLTATLTFATDAAQVPVVAISMSALGTISRLAGSTFGSAITFASGQAASAPGQLPFAQLKSLLKQ